MNSVIVKLDRKILYLNLNNYNAKMQKSVQTRQNVPYNEKLNN